MKPYRARRVDTNKWVYGWYVEHSVIRKAYILERGFLISHTHLHNLSIPYIQGSHEVHASTVSQPTGRKDKHEVEIYGGMRVKAHIYSDETPQELQVEWRGTAYVIDYEDSETDCVVLSSFVGTLEIIPEGE